MSSIKLTPSEVLQRQKARLRLKSDALVETLENNMDYIQHNMGAIISNTVVDALVSKTPPLVQSLLVKGKHSAGGIFKPSALIGGAMDILPFFFKGAKGWLAHWVLNQAKKWIFKRP